jgi:hypothetical protein
MRGVSQSVCEARDWPFSLGISPLAGAFHTEVEMTSLVAERKAEQRIFFGDQSNVSRLCMSLHDIEQVRK